MDNTSANSLISSDDVNGTKVMSPSGDDLGHIDSLMIDKRSGNVAYAVMAFGGFLGMGEDFHPIPWGKLKYDTGRDGYMTDITKEQLEGAPARSENWQRDRDWETSTYNYYGLPPYWI